MKKIMLNGKWSAKCFGADKEIDFTYEGNVPGCVHTDLMGTKIPEDIYYRDNADQCSWIEDRDFEYTKTFTIDSVPKGAKLVFEGLDTYTDIYLNGLHLGATEDMFISHTFDIQDALKEGENVLTVHFYSAVKKVEGLPLFQGAFTRERMRTRRIQCTYGWDWVARFVTCGIWRDVYITASDEFGVKDAYIYTDYIYDGNAAVVIEAEFENYEKGGFADVEIFAPSGERVYYNRVFRKESYLKEYVYLKDAKLWYPAGYGDQPLYKLRICEKEYTFGIRIAKIFELPDEKGSPYYNKCLEIKNTVSGERYDRNEEFSGFTLLINDKPILCKGGNWVPSEPFPSAETDEKITTILSLAKEANVNMLRVWGGGIFERQHFYNECDRLGILVTQDFLMACGVYPEKEKPFIEHLKREAEFAARKLRNHPSLVWWSGDNENAVHGYDSAEDYTGRTAIYEALFPVLMRLDPTRRLLLSSPYGGTPYGSKSKGTTHNTNYLGCSMFPYIWDRDMQDYKEHFSQYLARFIAEEPAMGAISLPSIKRFMTDDDIYNSDDMWTYHTRSNPVTRRSIFETLIDFSGKVLGDFKDGKDRYFKMKYTHYEWIRITLENVRRNAGFTNGMIYWMWNDCWPASSGWSIVDYYCLPKASFYSFKRCASGVIASIDKRDAYEIYLCNDTDLDKNIDVSISYLYNNSLNHIKTAKSKVGQRQAIKVDEIPFTAIPADAVLIADISCGGEKDRAFYKNGALNIAPTDAVNVLSQTENSITVTADSYVHAVELEGEYIFEDNFFSLLPNEVRTVTFRKASRDSAEGLAINAYTLEL